MFTDIMVDLETTGTNPEYNNIMQLAAVKFNVNTRAVCPNTFDRALLPAPNRFWDEGGRDFWMKMPDVYQQIVERAEQPDKVLHDFYKWVAADQPEDMGYRFWAKPTTFDWTFLVSYCRQYEVPMPFHYRIARDVNSFISGLCGDASHPNLADEVEFKGVEHNAIWDCFHQIEVLFLAMDRYAPVTAEYE